MNFAKLLIDWYLVHKRDLPWRETKDPYKIFLSEIILQQTRVAQGLPYYLSFVEKYPTVFDIAKAEEQEVLRLWQGLGYYSRARNLHKATQEVVAEFNGVFPGTAKDLKLLKGVGDYTSAAIASFAYGEQVAVVDGNVFRVLSRVFGLEDDISVGSTKKIFQKLADSLIPDNQAAQFNQAIMEFGALHCVPKSPDCSACIFTKDCVANQVGKVAELPIKTKKTKVSKKYFNYLVVEDRGQNIIIEKREGKGIWQNLYQFPLLETKSVKNHQGFELKIKEKLGIEEALSIELLEEATKVHKLSHQHIHVQFWSVKVKRVNIGVRVSKISEYPFPIVIANFIEQNWNKSFN